MKRLLSFIPLLLFFFIKPLCCFAKITLPAIVGSNMVLQRNTNITLWGWADPNEAITIKASWLEAPIALRANAKGHWSTTVATTNSKTAQTIALSSPSSTIILDNVVFGEVWLCSGQSNMFQPLEGYPGQPTFGGPEAILNAKTPNLRLFTVARTGAKHPIEQLETYTGWQEATPLNSASFSAVAYFFGQKLQEVLEVPVGLIHCSWGGSKIEAWMSASSLTPFQEVTLPKGDISKIARRTPTVLFNAMLHPLLPYTIKGVLWYQGESNRSQPEAYKQLFPALVKDWRKRWQIGEFPFYYVQIAPYGYDDNSSFQNANNSAFIREAQLQCLELIPNSGIAITLDIGRKNSIHPPQKKEVALRLLYNALHQTYGYNSIAYATPIFKTLEPHANGLILNFKNATHGLYSPKPLEAFEIAGKDQVFYPATAKIVNRKQVHVYSPKVPRPIAVRYAWNNWVKGTLFTTGLLPVSSFRTDAWSTATRAPN